VRQLVIKVLNDSMLPTFIANISVLHGPLILDTLLASVHRTFENALRVL